MFSASFLPHGYCIGWNPVLLWSLVMTNATIGVAYYSILIALVYVVRHRFIKEFSSIFLLFGFFIAACGTMHFVEVYDLWRPIYRLDAAIRLIMALASLATAITLWQLLPKVRVLIAERADSRAALEEANQRLSESLQLLEMSNHQLAESERRLRLIHKAAPIGKALVGLDGRFISVNPALYSMLGYTEAELLARTFQEITHPDDLQADLDLLSELVDGRRDTYRMEKRYFHKQGNEVQVQLDVSVLRDESGTAIQFISQIQDVTARNNTQAELRRLAAEVEDLYDHAPCGYHSLDEAGVIVRANQTQLQWLGYSKEELIGKRAITELMTSESAARFLKLFPELKSEIGRLNGDFDLLCKDGSILPVHLSATAISDADGRYQRSRCTLFDITERKRLEGELIVQAQTDFLTGLNNRRSFIGFAKNEVDRIRRMGGSVSMLMLDVDHFKQVNDTYGHRSGDEVLLQLAAILNAATRGMDVLGRLGGEEFAVLLPATNPEQALQVAGRMKALIESTLIVLSEADSLHITASIGVASCDGAEADVELLLKRADIGLYIAKASGRNKVCFSPGSSAGR